VKKGILWIFLCVPLWVGAHPHLWIEVDLDFTPQGEVLIHWEFDEFFSSDMILSYDTNNSGELEQPEQDRINQKIFRNMINYKYFVDIRHQGKVIEIPRATHFKASIKDNKLVYDFRLPLNRDWDQVEVIPWDKEYFADMRLRTSPSMIKGTSVTVSRRSLKLETMGWGEIAVDGVLLEK